MKKLSNEKIDRSSKDVKQVTRNFLHSEDDFYGFYSWCLNPFPLFSETLRYLELEASHFDHVAEHWQIEEIKTNISLLGFSISDSVDNYLDGNKYDFSKLKRMVPVFGSLLGIPEKMLNAKQRIRYYRLKKLRDWRSEWERALFEFVKLFIQSSSADIGSVKIAISKLTALLEFNFPLGLQQQCSRNPAAFRSQDLAFQDVVKLAEMFFEKFSDLNRPILIIGLRTAGSYFAPVLSAYLVNRGFKDFEVLTLRPKRGASPEEMSKLKHYAYKAGMAVLIDEPVYQGVTLTKCVKILKKSGFKNENVVALFPLHPMARDWQRTDASIALKGCDVITLEPEETFKYKCFEIDRVESRLREYFSEQEWQRIEIASSYKERKINEWIEKTSDEKFHTRMKRVYEVNLTNSESVTVTRYILAKSVGWGWFGYSVFFAAKTLEKFIPRVLGLRDGIMYMEWLDLQPSNEDESTLKPSMEFLAEYIATRCKGLRFAEDPSPKLCKAGLQYGMEILAERFCNVYGWSITSSLRVHSVMDDLAQMLSPTPTLVDAKMRRSEWLVTDSGFLKTDFEQHGLGKIELSVTDPAYDLADCVLSFELGEDEESQLVECYGRFSGDRDVAKRLPIYKILAGAARMNSSASCLSDIKLAFRHEEFNRSYVNAWMFSMIQMARFCAGFVSKSKRGEMNGIKTLVVSDVDGILDQHTFGFPTTTLAGIKAISLLNSHGLPVILNTARSRYEVQEYCTAYDFVGGVAEYGSYIWDATTGLEKVLVPEESLEEIARVRQVLSQLPGIFINHFYRYSIKAFTYKGRQTAPVPTAVLHGILKQAGARNLCIHHTASDSAITAKQLDKGTGMLAFLKLIGRENIQTIAIGDTAPDLAMFKLATRSYAPAHTPVKELALLLGCHVVDQPYQAGFYQIVRDIIHSNGDTCVSCYEPQYDDNVQTNILLKLLAEADRSKPKRFLSAIVDRRSLKAFVK